MAKLTRLKTVVIQAPGQCARIVAVADINMAFLQAQVGGCFQCLENINGTKLNLWCNEDGSAQGLAPNLVFGMGAEYVVGTVVITGGSTPSGNTRGLTAKQALAAVALLTERAI